MNLNDMPARSVYIRGVFVKIIFAAFALIWLAEAARAVEPDYKNEIGLEEFQHFFSSYEGTWMSNLQAMPDGREIYLKIQYSWNDPLRRVFKGATYFVDAETREEILVFDAYYGLDPIESHIYYAGFHRQNGMSVFGGLTEIDSLHNGGTIRSVARLPDGKIYARKDRFLMNDADQWTEALSSKTEKGEWVEIRKNTYDRVNN